MARKQAYCVPKPESWSCRLCHSLGWPELPRFPILGPKPCEPSLPCPFGPRAGSGPLGFRMIADTAALASLPTSPVPSVAPAAKMRSRAALYRAERSANDPTVADAAGAELLLSLAPFWVDAAERLRMRMGDWKAEAGGTTPLGMDPVLGEVTTS
jgi:hypothetical protein